MFIHVTWWNICITALKLYNGHVVYDKLEHMRNMRASKFYKIKRLQNLGNVYFKKKNLKFYDKFKWIYYIFLSYANCIAE